MGFNIKQQKALDVKSNRNAFITAGAGSGKTKTLTEKVYLLLNDKNNHLEPSQLLVLTFTNNAAHEMKTRIIERCKNNLELKDKIVSSHIQTFDSFSLYLLEKYSALVGVSSDIKIANEDVLNAKIHSSIDELFSWYYKNDFKRIFSTLRKLSLHNDEPLKNIVIDLYNRLDNFLPKDREKYISKIKDLYNDNAFFDSLIDDYVFYFKNELKKTLIEAVFLDKNFDLLNATEKDYEAINKLFTSDDFHILENLYLTYSFNQEILDKQYQTLLSLLDENSYSFICKIKTFLKEKDDKSSIFNKECKKKINKDDKQTKAIFDHLSNFNKLFEVFETFGSLKNKSINGVITYELDVSKEKEKIYSFKDDVYFLFEIVNKLYDEILDYQKATNAYTFKEIAKLTLKVFEHEEALDEIKEQFRYIMIDEYQDTNDVQEAFLSYLLSERKSDHKCATLFVVGDAKQSIYAFRNSDVALFNKRLNDKNFPQDVIEMNINYRSGKKLLDEINYLFKKYMRMDHGGIDYMNPGEQLTYDDKINPYSLPYSEYGIHRIIGKEIPYDGLKKKRQRALWEAYAIVDDIQKKINDPNFLISDFNEKRENILRRAKYNDFCILVRKKAGYKLYQDVFVNQGIKLNVISENSLSDSDVIIVIQSLVNLVSSFILKDKQVDVPHLVLSLMRSYIYCYSDAEAFSFFINREEKKIDYSKIYNSLVYKEVKEFALIHQNDSFANLFIELIKKFRVMENLYLLGNVSGNISIIESLYSIILSQEETGEGLEEFVNLINNINKYALQFTSESIISVEDAVDLMTIHASKGLERKIVYLPLSYNNLGRETNLNKPPYQFSKKYGLAFKYYEYQEKDEMISFIEDPVSLQSKVMSIYDENVEVDEHVRLFYVALTRAKNSVYIVGDNLLSNANNKKDENLYALYSDIPFNITFNTTLKNRILNQFPNSFITFDRINEVNKIDYKYLESRSFSDKVYYETYQNLKMEYFDNAKENDLNNELIKLTHLLFALYIEQLHISYKANPNILVEIYSLAFFNKKISDINELFRYIKTQQELIEIDEDNDEKHFKLFDPIDFENFNDLKTFIFNELPSIIFDNKTYLLGISPTDGEVKSFNKFKKDNLLADYINFEFEDTLFLPLMQIFDNTTRFYETKYGSDEFEDARCYFTINNFNFRENNIEPQFDEVLVNESEIEFKERFKMRASKTIKEKDDDLTNVLSRGVYLHNLLEIIDFKNPDLSFINNKEDRVLIEKVLALPIFKRIKASRIYKEYPYYDQTRGTTGFIDLLFIENVDGKDVYNILDYKSANIDDDAYLKQLTVYKENVINLFKLDEKTEINLYLLSISQQIVKKL